MVGGNYCGSYAFGNVTDKAVSVEWMDNGEQLGFAQSNDILAVHMTGFPYGLSTCVRVAKEKLK